MTKSKIAIYQVLVRLFQSKKSTNIPDGDYHQNGSGKFNFFTKEVLEKIKTAGHTHIWYTGIIRHATTTDHKTLAAQDNCIVKGKAGSPYAITDYFDVCPDLAESSTNRMQEFEALLKRTKETGLKSIIDFVPNHVSRAYKSTKKPKHLPDLGENDNPQVHFNAQNNFYYLPRTKLDLQFCENQEYKEEPAKVSGNDCFHHQPNKDDWYETIKLNYGVDVQNQQSHFHPIPNTWQRMLEILLFWADKNIDGFRCDMTEMVAVEFWEWVIPQVKAKNPNIVFIAEIYQPHLYESYIKQGGFDYLYDKVGLYDTLKRVIRNEAPASQISDVWKSLNGLDAYMLRFLENHDEQRIASEYFASDTFAAMPAFLLSACMHQGPIMSYFGQEIGENGLEPSGFSGNDGRSSIFDYGSVPSISKLFFQENSLTEDESKLYKKQAEILNFCIKSPIIAHGAFYDLMWANEKNPYFFHNHIYTFLRSYKGENLLFIINFSHKAQQQKIIIPEHALTFSEKKINHLKDICFIDTFTHKEIRINQKRIFQEGIAIEIEAYGYGIYAF
ncbi:MAG: alpha-amylase [Bacteroidetes bacterium 4572_77]|nr:MAG: alpha-amylase [Bacteroidetes bacterium 4572_77]